jgi:hypothetical protein
MLVKIECLL